MSYDPIPPRVWSRVQNPCTFILPDDQYLSSYIPLTGQTVSQGQADYEMKQLYKGNILQYKGNSARLTKSQKYSQLARCSGPNRTKVFATQSETYTNPNTTGLLRQNFITYPFPNDIVGAPNNISGPFAYNIPNPNNCPGFSIQDGGTLVCGTYVNPCSGEIIKNKLTPPTICNPASASNVPGSAILCWNVKAQTWFPRQRYVMNNSTNKWPINYKGLVSALTCSNSQPKLSLQGFNNNNNITFKQMEYNDDIFDIYNDLINTDKSIINTDKSIINTDKSIINSYKNIMNRDTYTINDDTYTINGDTATIYSDTDLYNSDTYSVYSDKNMIDSDRATINSDKNMIDSDRATINSDKATINSDKYKVYKNKNSNKYMLSNKDMLNNKDMINIIDTDITDIQNILNTDAIYKNSTSYDINIDLKPNSIFPVDSFNIYVDGIFYKNVVNNKTYKYTITNLTKVDHIITITSVTNGIESTMSRPIYIKYTPIDRSPLPPVETNNTCELKDICRIMNEKFGLLNTSISNVFLSTTNISDRLTEFEILKALLNSTIIKEIGSFIEQYVMLMYDDSTVYMPIPLYDEFKTALKELEEILLENPELLISELATISTKNIRTLRKTKSNKNITNRVNKIQFLSPDSINMGKVFIGNYNEILSLLKNAFDKKIEARAARLDSVDWKKDSDILNNAIKLKEYIENLNKTISLFNLGVETIPVELKQQYIIYHSLYGVPPNLEYDPKLMKPILEDLGLFDGNVL